MTKRYLTPADEAKLGELLIGGVNRTSALAELEQLIATKVGEAVVEDRRLRGAGGAGVEIG